MNPSVWCVAYPPTQVFGEKLRNGCLKMFSDGGTCGDLVISV